MLAYYLIDILPNVRLFIEGLFFLFFMFACSSVLWLIVNFDNENYSCKTTLKIGLVSFIVCLFLQAILAFLPSASFLQGIGV